ncbi:acyl-CoA-binding protein [Maribacter sp. 4U21]|jgi:acyl-CoA-binding protein|uniref:acyl-CoA-binding protein n=1 Tax=Maribacter sp. 4U21 TaxID=1889779 RepID=UPI000C15780B|nr:acyl-CoA-binding protein [Maribacter sp. 4U21]PIB26415.1 acyl-CoA-binding protein [Maribacter sp. 4U21]
MKKKKLHTDFKEAIDFVNSYQTPIPADVLLKLYAYYKIAHENFENPGSKTPLINAFKANALIQAKNIDQKAAMKSYIKLVNQELR